jgi:dihydroorotase
MNALLLMLLLAASAAAQPYDILIRRGHVIDPKNRINRVTDVAVAEGKIARVAENIPAAEAKRVIEAQGLYVTPGLVDLHVHVYAGTGTAHSFAGDYSIYPDGYMLRGGVTTAVDAGSSGWRNFPDFKQRVIDRAVTRVLSMLNIVGHGMGGEKVEQNTADMDAPATAKVAKQYPDVVVGIKTAHYAAPDWIAVDRAVEAGQLASLPVMVDFGRFTAERPYQDLVLKHLRPGDISTHMYLRAVPMLDDNKKLLPYLLEARKRGVLFDLGHGNASFSWAQAVYAVKQGWWPDTISSDAHIRSTLRSMKDLPTTMSKLLILGVPFDKLIEMSTLNAAQAIKRPDLGHLTVGSEADLAVFSVQKGKFGYFDGANARYMGDRKIFCELTLRKGEVVWDLNGLAADDWDSR